MELERHAYDVVVVGAGGRVVLQVTEVHDENVSASL